MELNREQIIKALECCADRQIACRSCPYMNAELADDDSCAERMELDALALIKELTAENDAWQKQLISQKEISDKAYYELACEVENLRADNARYEAENNAQFDKWLKLEEATKRHHEELFQEAKIAVKEDTVRKMQERFKMHFGTYVIGYKIPLTEALKVVNQIAKDMLEGEK